MRLHGHVCGSILICTVAQMSADTVTLQNDRGIEGTVLGSNARQIDFLATSGESLRIQIGPVKALTFASVITAVLAAAAPPSRTVARPGVLIPASTSFRIHTVDAIDVDATQAGMKLRRSLDDPIMSSGAVIVRRGADVVLVAAKVARGGRTKGSDPIELYGEWGSLPGGNHRH